MHDIGLENLRFGIVEQAIDDYLSILAGFIVPTTDCNLAELERFFYSDWFSVLCKLEPEFIIESLKRKAKKMILKYTVSKQKGSSRYYVHEVGSKEPIHGTLGTKKQALHRAAKMNDLDYKDYKDYMRVRRRDGVSCDKD